MELLDMIKHIYDNKFYISDTYDSILIYVDKKYGVINVKDSLHYNKIVYLSLSAPNLTCMVDEVATDDLRKYNIDLDSFIELMTGESRKL
jgi:hypothetical protein